MKNTNEILEMIMQGKTFEITTDSDVINVWNHKKLGCNIFVLELNGQVIKQSKQFTTMFKKITQLLNTLNK